MHRLDYELRARKIKQQVLVYYLVVNSYVNARTYSFHLGIPPLVLSLSELQLNELLMHAHLFASYLIEVYRDRAFGFFTFPASGYHRVWYDANNPTSRF